ncbi:MAG TPA: hypothetical protein VEA69_11130 [Tepidisphaeraceae bacterium]|nr:hypothetical protein [Tepidisphaeraceae bacterium]
MNGHTTTTNARMGELLQGLGKLSEHDIHEVLAEQRAWPRRFGEIAVTLGFCEPEHVWSAWCRQLDTQSPSATLDLDEIGIDAQAVDHLPAHLAHSLKAVPLRFHENRLIVAVADPARVSAADLTAHLGVDIRCVRAREHQVDRMLEKYYAPAVDAA